MQHAEAVSLLARLCVGYPSVTLSPASSAFYVEVLARLPLDVAAVALDHAMEESPAFFPPLPLIMSFVGRELAGEFPSASEAWEAACAFAGIPWGSTGCPHPHPLIERAAGIVGIGRIRSREQSDGFAQRDFERAYVALCRAAQTDRTPRLVGPQRIGKLLDIGEPPCSASP